MSPLTFTLLLIGVLLNATAQLLLKAGTRAVGSFSFEWHSLVAVGPKLALDLHILGGLLCYAISVVVWILALSRVPVSVAYPLLSIGYIVNALAARWLFDESLTSQKIIGIGIIIIGVVLLTRSH